jgi:acetyltransferase
MAFIATAPRSPEDPAGGEETLAAVRAIADPDNHDAEFGILVRSDLKGGGMGRRLMDKMIEYLKSRGTQRLVCTVLRENVRMLELAAALGMSEEPVQPEAGVVRLFLPLTPPPAS